MKALGLLVIMAFAYGCTSLGSNCVNVTCNGVTTCRDPANIPPCAPLPPTNATCPDGYVCGIPANGCAVPGAIYNCPNEPANLTANGTEAVNLTQELNNSAAEGFNLTVDMFSANSSSECSKELISPCDNNVPTQFICINQRFVGVVSSQRPPVRGACPMFMMAGDIYCGLDDGFCVVMDQR